jgi:CHAD domain-containing protein
MKGTHNARAREENMPYRLKRGESVPDAIRRIVQEEIDSATEQLSNSTGQKREEAIHEARKSFKKIRGAMRLVQPELGQIYRAENIRMRDVARQLSQIRDAQAIIEVFDQIREKYGDTLQKDALASIRHGLENSKRETENGANVNQVVRRALTVLRASAKRVKGWPLNKDGFQAIATGLKNRYRRGRDAMRIAQKDPAPENYHEWRKRVKDHWYHVRLLESLWTDVMQAHEGSLKNLETWLGDDHNLVVLRQTLNDNSGQYGEQKEVQLFLALADQYQKELRENAMSLGQRVYEQKPGEFTRNFSKLWDAWQEQPASMKEVQKEQRSAAKKQPQRAASPAPRKHAVA